MIGELAIRLLIPQRLVQGYVAPDPELGNVLRPDQNYVDENELYTFTVRTNHQGFRMDEPVDRTQGACRVLALGDSFTFGWGVEIEDAFLSRIGRAGAKGSIPAQLINGGVGAYSTGHVRRALARRTMEVNPVAAIYFMNANDLNDNIVTNIDYRVASYRLLPNDSIEIRDEFVYPPLKRFLFLHTPYAWLNQHSHLFILLKLLLQPTRVGHREQAPVFGTGHLDSERGKLAREVTLAHVDRIDAFARERRLPLLVVWIPAWTEIFEPEGAVNEEFRRFKHAMESRASPVFFDPLPRLRALVEEREYGPLDLYYRDGDPMGHFTVLGNEVYARSAQDRVLEFVKKSCAP